MSICIYFLWLISFRPPPPLPSEIYQSVAGIHTVNKTDPERGAERQGSNNQPDTCEAWDKQAPLPCIPGPLHQGKIELNKAKYVLLMVVFLLKI